jgi:TrmH family RNA methyltransferase
MRKNNKMAERDKITSIKDERVIEARELSTVAGRRRRGKFLLEGEQAMRWALDAGVRLEHIFVSDKPGFFESAAILPLLDSKGIPVYSVSEGILKKITDTNYVVPLVGVGKIHESKTISAEYGDFVLLLDGVEDHGNIGTIVRTARSFGIKTLVATGSDIDLFYRKTIDASRGKVFAIRLERFGSSREAITKLKRLGYQIVATSPRAPILQSAVKLERKPLALVLGNEKDGISENVLELADIMVQIPMNGSVESLNVGVAAGISVYELKIKLVIAMLVKYIRSTLGREINVASKTIQMALDAELQKVSSFTSEQIILLMILKCDETMTLEQAGKDTTAFGEELEELLEPLLNEAYILRREKDSDDRIEITEKGEQLLAELWPVIEAAEDKILAGFDEREKTELFDYLKRIQDNCISIINSK